MKRTRIPTRSGFLGHVLDRLCETADDNHDKVLGVEMIIRVVVEDKEHRERSMPTLDELEDLASDACKNVEASSVFEKDVLEI